MATIMTMHCINDDTSFLRESRDTPAHIFFHISVNNVWI